MSDIVDFVDQVGRALVNSSLQGSVPNATSEGRGERQPEAFTQWTQIGGAYFPAGPTQATLPPTSYNIVPTQVGLSFQPFTLVTDSLLELPDRQSSTILASIRRFWASKEKFDQRGQVFKRGVLLWGPAGSGKSCTVALLCRDIIEAGGLVVTTDAGPSMMIGGLRILRIIEPARPVVVILEDLDEIIERYGERELLALLDGQHQISNVCFVATTNFPERLSSRVACRPSRFDEIVKVGMPSAEARRLYLTKRTTVEELAERERECWVADTDGMGLASLRELIVGVFCLGNAYEDVLEKLKAMQHKIRGVPEFKQAPIGLVARDE